MHFTMSPWFWCYLVDGSLLYSEYCDCPKRIVSECMEEAGCSQNSQLDIDLSQWSTINFEEVLR